MSSPRRRLRVAYLYRRFSRRGSIESFYSRNAERLSRDEDVTAVCSRFDRAPTDAPLRFLDVDPLITGRSRYRYAAECLSFAVRASRRVRRLRDRFAVVRERETLADLVRGESIPEDLTG